MNTNALSGIALAACLCLTAGCRFHSRFNGQATTNVTINGRSEISSTAGSRHLHIVADGPASGETSKNNFTVTFSNHILVIEKDRLLLDQTERAKFPADAKEFEGTLNAGTLTVKVDGGEVLTTPLK